MQAGRCVFLSRGGFDKQRERERYFLRAFRQARQRQRGPGEGIFWGRSKKKRDGPLNCKSLRFIMSHSGPVRMGGDRERGREQSSQCGSSWHDGEGFCVISRVIKVDRSGAGVWAPGKVWDGHMGWFLGGSFGPPEKKLNCWNCEHSLIIALSPWNVALVDWFNILHGKWEVKN